MRRRRKRATRAIGSTLAGGVGLVLVVVTSGAVLQSSAASQALAQPGSPAVVVAAMDAPTPGTVPVPEELPVPTVGSAPMTARGDSGAADASSTWQRPAGMRLPDSDMVRSGSAPVEPGIAPAPVIHLRVPAIDVDADVLPVDSTPTGGTNAWGGEIYGAIDFPVDQYVRQWVRRGDPNTLPTSDAADTPRAFDRVLLYGHASDIGNHLVFQDLAALQPGDSIIATTELGTFEYHVTMTITQAKANLDNLPELYDYPPAGAKEIALVACLPNTTFNAVVIGTLIQASPIAP